MPINYWFHSLFTLSDNFSGIILTENMNLKVAMEKHWATNTLLIVAVVVKGGGGGGTGKLSLKLVYQQASSFEIE